jgi:hypothetical protein
MSSVSSEHSEDEARTMDRPATAGEPFLKIQRAPLAIEECFEILTANSQNYPTVNRIRNPKAGQVYLFKPQKLAQLSKIL